MVHSTIENNFINFVKTVYIKLNRFNLVFPFTDCPLSLTIADYARLFLAKLKNRHIVELIHKDRYQYIYVYTIYVYIYIQYIHIYVYILINRHIVKLIFTKIVQ